MKERLVPYLFLVCAALIWAGNLIVGRAIYQTITPTSLSFWRWLIALMILLPFEFKNIIHARKIIGQHFYQILAISTTGMVLYSILIYKSLHFTYAANSGVLLSMAPIFIVIISTVVYKEKFTLIQFFGFVTSLLGVLLLVTKGAIFSVFTIAYNKGDILVLVAGIVWAVNSVLLQKKTFIMNTKLLFTICILIGVIILLPFFLVETLTGQETMLSEVNIVGVSYVAIFSGAVAYYFWAKGVEVVGASRAGLFFHCIPVFSTILGIVLLQESISWFHGASFLLVFTGIVIANYKISALSLFTKKLNNR